ncbi:MAG: tetratricopeptide repeat protein [Candidatus Abyssobacteria bacterium SURF_5]|uniref:Tetratricopeptide repeat protein n=1 Tax=Abyssobacteria bacterium (strain SURF_5) TaxID=2093360 RepID=A0A3A4NP52_ABYX5|nr:MAG: tetratricopeptide repeat protein [Candidatus Abyssubacteria bacterium SURF_5]
MAGPKVTRKDLKEDKIYTTIARVTDFIVRRRLELAIGIFALLALFALGYYRHIRANRLASEASLALYRAEGLKDNEKEQGLLNVSEDYAGTPAAVLAKYQRANFLYNQRKYEEARREFFNFAKNHPNHPAAPAALEAAGYSLESLGLWAEAINEYERVKKKYPSHPAATRARYRLGLCHERMGNVQDAIEAYESVSELLPDSLWADYAQERLASLGVKKTPEPDATQS